jgi:catechol 2,3-dioxygenase-like lactoylglutathione lyase family enzyme
MKLKLHHVNLCSANLPAMDTFYRDVLDMETEPSMAQHRIKDQGYPGDVSFCHRRPRRNFISPRRT